MSIKTNLKEKKKNQFPSDADAAGLGKNTVGAPPLTF